VNDDDETQDVEGNEGLDRAEPQQPPSLFEMGYSSYLAQAPYGIRLTSNLKWLACIPIIMRCVKMLITLPSKWILWMRGSPIFKVMYLGKKRGRLQDLEGEKGCN